MKQLKCEMCGSADMLKEDGVFVCQSCGCKYSVEEAKKMMVEGTVDVQGTVRIDEHAKIDNYYAIAKNAYDANNKFEAELYCNKIVEIDPLNYKAWFMKGKVAGWLSSLENIRINESINCFIKALDNAPKNEIDNLKTDAAFEISKMSNAIMNLCCDNFAKFPSSENGEAILQHLESIKIGFHFVQNTCGVETIENYNDIAFIMHNAVCAAWSNDVVNEYYKSQYPTEYNFRTFNDICNSCIKVIDKAINISNDNQANISRYENLITFRTEYINTCFYEYSSDYGVYVPKFEWYDEARQRYFDDIVKYYDKIKEIDPSYDFSKEKIASDYYSLSMSNMQLACHNFEKVPTEFCKNQIIECVSKIKIDLQYLRDKLNIDLREGYEVATNKMDTAVYNAWVNVIQQDYKHSEYPSENKFREFISRCNFCEEIVFAAIELVGDNKQSNILRYKNLITINNELINSCSYKISDGGYVPECRFTDEQKNAKIDLIMSYHNKIKKLDPSYQIPGRPKTPNHDGCYVATCVYGSYDCPQVWTLRRYRDNTLASTWYGRAFIKTYYAISPTVVKWFGNTEWFKKMWRKKLDRMVSDLRNNGVEDTPYEDKEWR